MKIESENISDIVCFGYKEKWCRESEVRELELLYKSRESEIEALKCLYAENYRQLLAEAEDLYQHYPNNFRKTADEYFLEEKEYLKQLDKKE